MGVIEIEYELNKINVFTKSEEEPSLTGIFSKKTNDPYSRGKNYKKGLLHIL
jgi:hypothetical protein